MTNIVRKIQNPPNQQAKTLHNGPVALRMFSKFETLLLASLSLLALSGVYILFDESFFSQFIRPQTDGLIQVAKVSSIEGNSLRRTAIDTLWLPVLKTQNIYSGDFIFSDSKSSIEIVFHKNSKVFVDPNSFLRIKLVDGVPSIKLSRGKIKAEIEPHGEIVIQNGNSSVPEKLSAGSHQLESHKSLAQNGPVEKSIDQTQSESKKDSKQSSSSTMAVGESGLALPTPKDQTLFLIKKPKDIAVGALEKCPDNCELRIIRDNETIFKETFEAGQQTVIVLKASEIKFGNYVWEFSTRSSSVKLGFNVLPFTNKNFADSLDKNVPVEILN